MLATAGSCLFGLFGVQRPPRQILVVRITHEVTFQRLRRGRTSKRRSCLLLPRRNFAHAAPVSPLNFAGLVYVWRDVAHKLRVHPFAQLRWKLFHPHAEHCAF